MRLISWFSIIHYCKFLISLIRFLSILYTNVFYYLARKLYILPPMVLQGNLLGRHQLQNPCCPQIVDIPFLGHSYDYSSCQIHHWQNQQQISPAQQSVHLVRDCKYVRFQTKIKKIRASENKLWYFSMHQNEEQNQQDTNTDGQ